MSKVEPNICYKEYHVTTACRRIVGCVQWVYLPRTLDNEKLDNPTWGPLPQSLKQGAGRQDDDLVIFGLK